jgi:uncharacterized protein (DUF1499 family)
VEADMGERRSRAALGAAVLGVLAAGDAVLGPVLAGAGIVRPLTGFLLFVVGAAEALLGTILALVAFRRTKAGSGRSGRGLAWLGFAASTAVLAAVVQAGSAGRGLPRINDITTNPADPPGFQLALADPANAGRDMSYPAQFAAQQRSAYPDLAPISLALPVGEALERSRHAAESLGWEIAEVRPPQSEGGEGVLEARQVSGLFHFVDDVVVRVRPAAGGSVVDVRSKSRDGQGDLGVNAKRIRAFREALTRG